MPFCSAGCPHLAISAGRRCSKQSSCTTSPELARALSIIDTKASTGAVTWGERLPLLASEGSRFRSASDYLQSPGANTGKLLSTVLINRAGVFAKGCRGDGEKSAVEASLCGASLVSQAPVSNPCATKRALGSSRLRLAKHGLACTRRANLTLPAAPWHKNGSFNMGQIHMCCNVAKS